MIKPEENIIVVYKPMGITPLQAIEELKNLRSKYREQKISYAGRLDPMAEGVLILLIGDENKKRKEYEGLKKVYEAEIVIGISTDTFDALGMIQRVNLERSHHDVKTVLNEMIGEQDQFYPPFSSKTVNARPLYWWARENRLSEIDLPSKKIVIDEIKIIKEENIIIKDLVRKILEKISKVQGDFRQEEIKKAWLDFEQKHPDDQTKMVGVRISCSSGTYVRGIASVLGETLGVGAFAYSIKRIQVGEYTMKDCVEITSKSSLI